MKIKAGTSEDQARMLAFATVIENALRATPFRPAEGDQSLMVYALMFVAGRLTSRCPATQRGAVIEAMQDFYAKGSQP